MFDTDKLVEMWNSGLTATEIGKELGVTKNAIIGRVNRLREKGVGLRTRSEPEAFMPKSNITILELKDTSCRYILNTDTSSAVYCGKPKEHNAYCKAHAELCYRRIDQCIFPIHSQRSSSTRIARSGITIRGSLRAS